LERRYWPDRATALHRGRVEQHDGIGVTGALGGEDAEEPLDRLGKATPALVEDGLERQPREEDSEAAFGDRQELAIGGDAHPRLGDAEGDYLGVGHPSTGVLRSFGQEVTTGRTTRWTESAAVRHTDPQSSSRPIVEVVLSRGFTQFSE
jgi:hypothetical protein